MAATAPAPAPAREVKEAAGAGDSSSSELIFAINGEKRVIAASAVDSSITLNDYIRRHTPFKGTKLSCGEGGCGACAVRLSRFDAATGKVVTISVNSCLRPLATMDGWAVTTTEGLGSSASGFHAVQERIAAFNGTQCGFCTPGMAITTHVALMQAGDAGLSMAEIEAAFDGNICRCTGYRPILDAAKSFARDSDIEDFVGRAAATGATYDKSKDPVFPKFLESHRPKALAFAGSNGTSWVRPTTLGGVFENLARGTAAEVKLVVANTSIGIYKEESPKIYVDISAIPELVAVSTSDAGVSVGSSVSLDGLIASLRAAARGKEAFYSSSFETIIVHILKIANVHVRSIGSLGGNLCMAKKNGFLSDLATVLIGADASVVTATRAGVRTSKLIDFISTPFAAGELLVSVLIPFNARGDVYNSFKVAQRATNSHAFANAAFKLNIDEKSHVITAAVAAFGGVMEYDIAGAHAVRAPTLEAFLVGKPVNQGTLTEALRILGDEIKPVGGERAAYRGRLCSSFFYKYFLQLIGSDTTAVSPVIRSAARSVQRYGTSRGRQSVAVTEEHKPVSDPIPKIGGVLQASGEAQFIDDIPTTKDTLFAAYVQTNLGNAKIVSVDEKEALASPGVHSFISIKDIPEGGKNVWALMPFEQKPIFADTFSAYLGQPIGVILADTLRHAEVAAKLVKVVYDADGKKPIVTIADAKEAKSFWLQNKETKLGADPVPILEAAAATGLTASGEMKIGAQQCFYLETQIAHAIPEEDGHMSVWSANQGPDGVHASVAGALGQPMHKVKILMRRVGGGFGGKVLLACQHACIAAIAARKTGRAVRFPLDRSVDFSLVGGRPEIEQDYKVAFTTEGKVTAIKSVGCINAGDTFLIPSFTCGTLGSALSQVYDIGSLNVAISAAKTNTFLRGPVRGPAEIEASYMMETILEHISYVTGVAPELVRERNFFSQLPEDAKRMVAPSGVPITHYTVPQMWADLKRKCNLAERQAAVAAFNAANRWKKRGIALTPCRYQVGTMLGASSLVNIFGDGTIAITTTGTEFGQGLHTKVAQVVAYQLGLVFGGAPAAAAPDTGAATAGAGATAATESKTLRVPMSKIRIEDFSSAVLPNSGWTGGSVTSEKCAESARRAAEQLVDRLKPILDGLYKKQEDDVKAGGARREIGWDDLCKAAVGASVNMSAEGRFRGFAGGMGLPPADFLAYQNYGAACSEVELDVLTGEVNYLQADLLYDAGKSLNPAIDIGQVEGSFMLGVGFLFREETKMEEKTGRVLTSGTWNYKPPAVRDVPAIWNIELIDNKSFDKPGALLGSKATGEPPVVLAVSAIMAVRRAIASARRDAGVSDFFRLDIPTSPETLQAACLADPRSFTIGAPPAPATATATATPAAAPAAAASSSSSSTSSTSSAATA